MSATDVQDLGMVLGEIADVHQELCEQLINLKRNGAKKTASYRMKKYQHQQLGLAVQALQNAYMCLPQDFRV